MSCSCGGQQQYYLSLGLGLAIYTAENVSFLIIAVLTFLVSRLLFLSQHKQMMHLALKYCKRIAQGFNNSARGYTFSTLSGKSLCFSGFFSMTCKLLMLQEKTTVEATQEQSDHKQLVNSQKRHHPL